MFEGGIVIDLSKIEAMMRWERPTTVKEIRSFLGQAGDLLKNSLSCPYP